MFLDFYFFFIFAQTISARVGVLTCVGNNDCTDGYSCHEGICTKCFKCELLLRRGSDCVVDFKECGECLMGYERVLITDSSDAIKPCKPVRLKEELNPVECEDDKGCPPSYYCQEQACVQCFNCALVNRLSPFDNCAKLLSDCGYCMKGFEEVAVTANTDFKLCERQAVTVVPEMRKAIVCSYIITIGIFIIFISATAVAFNKRPKVKILTKSQCPKLPSAPPLYTMDMPQHVRMLEEQNCHVALTVDYKQQAKVFKQPTALYYYGEEESQGSEADLEITQENLSTFWAPAASNTEAGDEVPNLPGSFSHNHVEQSVGTSVTDSSQQLSDVSHIPISVSEHGDNQVRNCSGEDVDSDNSHEEKDL